MGLLGDSLSETFEKNVFIQIRFWGETGILKHEKRSKRAAFFVACCTEVEVSCLF